MSEPKKRKKRHNLTKATKAAAYSRYLKLASGKSKEFTSIADIARSLKISDKTLYCLAEREKWAERAKATLIATQSTPETLDDIDKRFRDALQQNEDSIRLDLAEAGAKAAKLANRKGGGFVIRNASAIKNVAEFSEKATAKWGGPTPEEQATTGNRLQVAFLMENVKIVETPLG